MVQAHSRSSTVSYHFLYVRVQHMKGADGRKSTLVISCTSLCPFLTSASTSLCFFITFAIVQDTQLTCCAFGHHSLDFAGYIIPIGNPLLSLTRYRVEPSLGGP